MAGGVGPVRDGEVLRDLSALSRRAVELPKAEPLLPSEVRAQVQMQVEVEAHLRCVGCLRRITTGYRARVVEIGDRMKGGRPQVTVATAAVCDDAAVCDALERVRAMATAMERVEIEWLLPDPAETSPPAA